MLLLFYTCLTTYFIDLTLLYDFTQAIKWGVDAFYYSRTARDQQKLLKNAAVILVFIFVSMLTCLVTMFTRFHIKLVFGNKTTIENLDKKGKDF